MKYVFLGIFAGLLLLSVVAWSIQPRVGEDGKIPLTWVSDDCPARRGQIDLFNQLHPQYELRLDPSNREMAKVIVQSIAGVGPDLFDCYGGTQLSAYVKAGIAWDVTDELEAAGIDVRNDIWRCGHPHMLYEGRVYGVLNNASVDCVWFHKDIFDKAGLPYPQGPWKWEPFIALAQKLMVRDEKGRVERFGVMFEWWNWRSFMLQWGGRAYTEDGTRCILDSPETVAGIQFMQDLIYTHRVAPSPVEEAAIATTGGWGSGTISFFGARKSAMALGGRWWLCTLRKYDGLRLGAVESPHGPNRQFRGYGRSTLINRHGPRREEALDFLKYLAGRDFNELINRQADAIGCMKRFCYTDAFLHNPEHPEEDFNALWRDVMELGVPDDESPFVNGSVVDRIMLRQLDLVKANQKTGEAAMRSAAKEINAEIQKTLERDPSLRKRYDALTKGGA